MSYHFRSFSETTTNGNPVTSNGFHQSIVINHHHPQYQHLQQSNDNLTSNSQQQHQQNISMNSQPDQELHKFIVHSDSQQSLDRLFNPPSDEPGSVPLRQRNLPLSFFNPTGIGSKKSDLERRALTGQPNLHQRSTSSNSCFNHQRPNNGIRSGLHLRTHSVLAPMTGLTVGNSMTSICSSGQSPQTTSLATSDSQFGPASNECDSSSFGSLNRNPNGSSYNLHQQQTTKPMDPQSQPQVVGYNPNNQAPHHHYRNYSSPAFMPATNNNTNNLQQQQYHQQHVMQADHNHNILQHNNNHQHQQQIFHYSTKQEPTKCHQHVVSPVACEQMDTTPTGYLPEQSGYSRQQVVAESSNQRPYYQQQRPNINQRQPTIVYQQNHSSQPQQTFHISHSLPYAAYDGARQQQQPSQHQHESIQSPMLCQPAATIPVHPQQATVNNFEMIGQHQHQHQHQHHQHSRSATLQLDSSMSNLGISGSESVVRTAPSASNSSGAGALFGSGSNTNGANINNNTNNQMEYTQRMISAPANVSSTGAGVACNHLTLSQHNQHQTNSSSNLGNSNSMLTATNANANVQATTNGSYNQIPFSASIMDQANRIDDWTNS